MSPERIERALREATREARLEPAPEIDWEAVEDRLPMTRVKTLPPRATSWRPALLAAALAVGAVVLGFALGRGRSPEAAVASAPVAAVTPTTMVTDIDGSALAVGARISAGDVPQSVVHRGHATWTLAPHSSAVLLTQGDVVAIKLEVGSVTSRVVKSSRIETFAVEAADVRVAAHGTEFVVTLAADGVSVKVTEGSVLVGPRDQPGVGQLLKGPAAGQFTLAGKPIEPDSSGLDALRPGRPPTSHVAANGEAQAAETGSASLTSTPASTAGSGSVAALGAPRVKATSPATSTSASPEPSAESLAPEQPTAAGVEAATNDVLKLSAACFKQRTATSDGVRVTAQTTITFRTLADGGVRSVVFEPPLSPWVQACINAGSGVIHTESTRYGFQVSRTVDLER